MEWLTLRQLLSLVGGAPPWSLALMVSLVFYEGENLLHKPLKGLEVFSVCRLGLSSNYLSPQGRPSGM